MSWAAAAAAGISTIGSLIASHQSADLSWEQLKAQHDFSREMFDANNAYNTPVNQVARLRAAGLNPYLADYDGAVGSGSSTMPSAPPSPSRGQLPDFAPLERGVSSALQLRQQKIAIDAQAGNQRAQQLSALIDNFSKVAKSMGVPAARKYLDDFAPFFIGADWEQSADKRALDAQIGKLEAEEDLSKVEASISKKYGEQRAEQELANMSMEFARINANIGLWSSIAKLNDSKIDLNSAEIKSIPSRIAMQFAQAASSGSLARYLHEKALTEQEMRDWFVGQLELDFYSKGFNVSEAASEWKANTGVRKQKETKYEQIRRTTNYMMDSSPALKVLHETERAIQSVPLKVPLAPNQPQNVFQSKARFNFENGDYQEHTYTSYDGNPY